MFAMIWGAALVGLSVAAFWYFLPRNGQEHPLVKNSSVGSMVTLAIMTVLTVGVVLLVQGLLG
jgi:hypothetical protein